VSSGLDGPQIAGDLSTIRDVQIHSAADWTPGKDLTATADTPSSGTPEIKLRAVAQISRVRIKGFSGNGVEVASGLVDTPDGEKATNVNNWEIYRVRIENCGGHGVYTKGVDVNTGMGRSPKRRRQRDLRALVPRRSLADHGCLAVAWRDRRLDGARGDRQVQRRHHCVPRALRR
jgi:hypothetical protein